MNDTPQNTIHMPDDEMGNTPVVGENPAAGDINEPRFIQEDGVEARVAAVIEPVLRPLGYRLVRIKLSGLNGLTLQIMAECADGTITIDDCELISRTVSPILDVEDLIERKYHLEVSSPGIDRPMVRKSDFVTWQSHIVKVETATPIDERRKFRGKITGVDETGFTLEADKAAYGEAMSVRIPFDVMNYARLILTDDLIREALQKDKELREAFLAEQEGEVEMQEKTQKTVAPGRGPKGAKPLSRRK